MLLTQAEWQLPKHHLKTLPSFLPCDSSLLVFVSHDQQCPGRDTISALLLAK